MQWWYAFHEADKRAARVYIGVSPEEHPWKLITTIVIQNELLKRCGTTKGEEGNLKNYLHSRKLERRLHVITYPEPWHGIVAAIPLLDALQDKETVLNALRSGVTAIQLLAEKAKVAKA